MAIDHATLTPLYSLPNEILVEILNPFPTQALLRLVSVSHRFHAIVLRILHYRLLRISSLQDYILLLECFHPVSKLLDPHFFCTYLGTPGLNDKYEGEGSLYEDCKTSECLERLSHVYSCFRPEVSGTELEHSDSDSDFGSENGHTFVKKHITLETFEDFSQLCSIVNLVKIMPNSRTLISAVTVDDGIIRVWRDWLKRQSKKEHSDNIFKSYAQQNGEDDILWVNNKKTVGLKLRVREKKWDHMIPIFMQDEEGAVNYEIEIEELRIRTTHLLLNIERSMAEQKRYPNAVVFGARHMFPPA